MVYQTVQWYFICYQWFKQGLILSASKPSINQWSQFNEDTDKPSMPAREFNLKADISDLTSLGLEHRLVDHHNQAARTVTLPIAPPGHATMNGTK